MSVLTAPLGKVAERVLKQFGQAVTFTRSTSAYNEVTGEVTSTVTSIAGYAVEEPGNVFKYKALDLVATNALTLTFSPTTKGLHARTTEFLLPGDTVAWNGVIFTVKQVDTDAPDGVVLAARVIATV